MTDVLLINPGSSDEIYQDLAKKYSAIEPPTWSLLLAKSCQSQGFKAEIMDCNAEKLTKEKILERIENCLDKIHKSGEEPEYLINALKQIIDKQDDNSQDNAA